MLVKSVASRFFYSGYSDYSGNSNYSGNSDYSTYRDWGRGGAPAWGTGLVETQNFGSLFGKKEKFL